MVLQKGFVSTEATSEIIDSFWKLTYHQQTQTADYIFYIFKHYSNIWPILSLSKNYIFAECYTWAEKNWIC